MDNQNDILLLAEEIIKNIELQEVPLGSIVLRCARLARITGNTAASDLFSYELAGYPLDSKLIILKNAYQLAKHVNRNFFQKDLSGDVKEFVFTETIEELENDLYAAKEQMKVAYDTNVSITSSNPSQHVFAPLGNHVERSSLRKTISEKSKKIAQLKSGYYNYVLGVYYEAKFKNIAEDLFKKRKLIFDKALSDHLPEAFQKFVSSYENLKSTNPEDWSNAVHSCRRILKDVADFLFPANDEEILISKDKKIKLTEENYVCRLKEYLKRNLISNSLAGVLGDNLEYLGNRLDSIYLSTNKGTHGKVEQREAESYVMYCYMLIGDIFEGY